MNAISPRRPLVWRLPVRGVTLLKDVLFGTLLCMTAAGAVVVFGWLARRMNWTVARAWGDVRERPGWILGPTGRGTLARVLGGLASNIRAGILFLIGVSIWTLPLMLAWLGAWWAGWENSFNKGYEQADIGPMIWLAATLVLLPILAHIPLMLAHAASEDRLGAMFELRRIQSLGIAAGWRLPALAFLSVLGALPFLGLRTAPVFIEGIVPGFADMTGPERLQVAQGLVLFTGFAAFTIAAYLRWRAACIYAAAASRAAQHPRFFLLWEDHPAAMQRPVKKAPSMSASFLWRSLACLIWAVLPIMIVIGQFMNYSWVGWLTHPVIGLPWYP